MTESGETTLFRLLLKKFNSTGLLFDDYFIDTLPSAPSFDTPNIEAVNQYDISALFQDLMLQRCMNTFTTMVMDTQVV